MKGKELGGHRGISVGVERRVGEGWRKVLTRVEGACEVPLKVLGMPSSRRGSQLGLGLNRIVEIS